MHREDAIKNDTDWGDTFISQGLATNHQKLRERPGTDSLSQPQEEPTLPTAQFQISTLRTVRQ